MAVFNVSTMRGFIETFTQVSGGDTIEILADLDWNDVYTEVTQATALSSTLDDLTINGNNHAMYNLSNDRITSTSIGRTMFTFGNSSNIKINNLSFLNCNMGAYNGAIMYANRSTTIYNTVVQGRFKGACFFGGGITVRDSMLTFSNCDGRPLSGTSSSASVQWDSCWIRFNNCSFTSDNNFYAYKLKSCYLEGKLGVISSSNNPKMFSGVEDSCINISGFFDSPTIPNFCVATGALSNIINCSKLTMLTPLTEADSTLYVKIVTDEHMKDAEYLASIGFNIVP